MFAEYCFAVYSCEKQADKHEFIFMSPQPKGKGYILLLVRIPSASA